MHGEETNLAWIEVERKDYSMTSPGCKLNTMMRLKSSLTKFPNFMINALK
jgi:hypothetical protein